MSREDPKATFTTFAKECFKDRPKTLVQEEKAPAYTSQYQQEIFDITYMYSECAKQANTPKLFTIAINIAIIPPQHVESIETTQNPLPQTSLLWLVIPWKRSFPFLNVAKVLK
jgi:hypothetical protein